MVKKTDMLLHMNNFLWVWSPVANFKSCYNSGCCVVHKGGGSKSHYWHCRCKHSECVNNNEESTDYLREFIWNSKPSIKINRDHDDDNDGDDYDDNDYGIDDDDDDFIYYISTFVQIEVLKGI